MENQKSSNSNILQLNTSRQFYTRRIAAKAPSNLHLDKVLKFLNIENHKKSIPKMKTEANEENYNYQAFNLDNMIKVQRLKLQKVLNKDFKQWKDLYDCFEGFKKSFSMEMLKKNQLNLLTKANEMLKTYRGNRRTFQRSDSRDTEKSGSIKKQFYMLKCQKQMIFLRNKLQEYQILLQQKQKSKKVQANCGKNVYNNRELSDECDELKKEKQYYLHALAELKSQKVNLTLKFNELQMTNQALCAQILNFHEINHSSLAKFQEYKNIMAMQIQQIISMKRDKQDIRKQLADVERKYQNMIKIFSKINNHDNKKLLCINQTKYVEVFSEQFQSFNKIRTYLANKQYYPTQNNPTSTLFTHPTGSSSKKDIVPNRQGYKTCYGQKQTLKNVDGVKKVPKEYYRYYKPTFFVFLQQYFQHQGVDKQSFNEIHLGVGINFIITLRAILDSKYNQLLSCKNVVKQFTNLSSFTMSWLSNYAIDNKTKKICSLNTDVCLQTVGAFYSRLMSPQLNYTWQVTTFRQLLMQTLSIDELMFYLKIRNMLMKGDCLTNKGSYLQIYHINYVDALLIVQDIVTDFDYRKKLEQYIKKSSQNNQQKQLIDAHFILRLLLEFYQYKKQTNFTIITKAFGKYTKQKNNSMPFETYLKIYDYQFAEITLLERIEIYEKSFSLGKGMINLESILTIMSQEGYLFYEVEKYFRKEVLVTAENRDLLNLDMPQSLQSFINCFQKLTENGYNKRQIVNYGLDDIKKILKSFSSTKEITAEDLITKIQLLFNIIILEIKKTQQNRKYSSEDIYQILNIFTIFYKSAFDLSLQKNIMIKMVEDFSRKVAGKKIITFYFRKKKFLSRLYLKKKEEAKELNKTQELRHQFSSMIDKLKRKYDENPKKSTKMVSYEH